MFDWKSHAIDHSRHRICIVVPHPDDFDLLVGHTVQLFLQHGWQVYEILMTFGEYGIVNSIGKGANRVKGKILQKIRIRENSKSKASYGTFSDGTPKVLTIPMRYIDGYVPFDTQSVLKLQQVLTHLKPAIIMGPDPVYSIDWHKDHMATARNCYFAIKKMEPSKQPKWFFLFQTFRANWHWPIQSWQVFIQAVLPHRSQFSPFEVHIIASFLSKLFILLRKNNTGLRKIDLTTSTIKSNKGDQFDRILDKIFFALLINNKPNTALYSPSPKELGLL